MNSRQQGAIAVSKAISYFTENGYIVSTPISEAQRYDLVVDLNGKLSRVEVKSTVTIRKSDAGVSRPTGNYTAQLRTNGGNRSGTGRTTRISSSECDLVFISCGNGSQYLFPVEIIEGMSTLTLSSKYDQYKLAG